MTALPAPRRVLSALLVVLALLASALAAAPATAGFATHAWTTETIYTASDGDFGYRDATLALRPDGSYAEVFLTPEDDATHPLDVLARTGGPGAWGPVEEVTTAADDATPYWVEAFGAPDGSVVAVWMVAPAGEPVLRSSVRAPDGGWSEPEVLATGGLTTRGLFREATGATLVWTTGADQALHSRTWSSGAWGTTLTAAGTFPTSTPSYAFAQRDDGQLSVAVVRDSALFVSQLDPGGTWSSPQRTHERYSACDTTVGVLDAQGNIKAIVTLCHQQDVTGEAAMAYAPNGDLHLWWNSWSGQQRVQGVYPNYSVVCDCSHGTSALVAVGGDLDAPAAGSTVPGMPRTADRRSVRKVWDDDGDLTVFVGGLGEKGRTINVYREGSTFAEPDATFQSVGSSASSNSSYVAEAFVSGDDILVGYQHSGPANGSCNSRLLSGDGTLSEPLGPCFDGNTDDYTAVQAPDGSVALATAKVRYFYFSVWRPAPVVTVPATLAVTWPAPTYGGVAQVPVSVTGGGAPASGTVRLRYGATVLDSAVLGPGGTASLALGRTALQPGARTLVVDYLGDGTVEAASTQQSVTVGRAMPLRPTVQVVLRPTSQKTGKVKVAVAAPADLARPTGAVDVVLRKGGATKQRTGSLSNGVVTVVVPKLARGSWQLTATYRGDARYLARASAAKTVKVVE